MFSLSNIFGSSVITIVNIYIWSKLLNQKLNLKVPKTYFLILSLIFSMIINYYYTNQFIRILSITLLMMIICKFIFDISISKAMILPIVSQFIIMISEFIFAIFIIFFKNISSEQFVNDYFTDFLTNLIIAFNAFVLIHFKFGFKVFNFLDKSILTLKKYEVFAFIIILVISVNFLEARIYYNMNLTLLLIINTLLIVIYSWIIFKIVNAKVENLTISEKYNRSKNSLTEYQSVVSRYRIDNHENKSQLKRLRNKIDKENKEAIEYIDMILDTRIKNNEKILNKTKIIPDSDLKVLIDSKIITMEEKNIKNRLHVDKEVKTIDLIEMDPLLMEDICKIVGVYLDNAIEAVETLDKKEIQLDLYKLDDFLCISVVNNYEGEIELDKLYDVGYTTKDNGHGYGLPLVAEIVDNNKNLSKETHVNEEIFRQVLKIKM